MENLSRFPQIANLHPQPLPPSFLLPSPRPRAQTAHPGGAGFGGPVTRLTWVPQPGGGLWGNKFSGGGGGRKKGWEKQVQKSLERTSPSNTAELGPTSCPAPASQKAKTHWQQKTYTHICKLQYKRATNLMIRDYYLKGPTVTDLFVISCNNTDGNEFICINVSVTRTSVEILH